MRTLQRVLLILALPVVGAMVGYGFGLAASEGRLERWRPLGTPPETATRLEARLAGVWATTEAGQWFVATGNAACAPNCWAAAAAPPVEPPSAPLAECVPLPRLGDVRTTTARCTRGVEGNYLVVYALRPDGSVWAWAYAAGAFGDEDYIGTRLGFSAGVGLMLLVLLVGGLAAIIRPRRPAAHQSTPPLL